MTTMDAPRLACLLLLAALAAAPLAAAQVAPGFYKASCPDVEKTIFDIVQAKFKQDPGTAPALLRLFFHDCFANGCDASILIDPLSNQASEKEAGPNVSVTGYDIIEEIKTELEKACKETVSCADIVAVAARDAVKLTGGPQITIPMGRRDSLTSNREDADNMPSPDIPVPKLMTEFTDRGFTVEEMILLLAGGHTVGTCKCFFIEMDTAPMDADYKKNLTSKCDGPKQDNTAEVPMDFVSPNVFDGTYFANVMAKKMPLTIDRLIGIEPKTEPIIKAMQDKPNDFVTAFAKAMEKLSQLKVLTGKDGEIRKSCSVFNNPQNTQDGPSIIRISSLQPDMMGSASQPGMPQPGAEMPQPGMPQPGMPQPGAEMPQPGLPQPGAAMPQPEAPQLGARKAGGHGKVDAAANVGAEVGANVGAGVGAGVGAQANPLAQAAGNVGAGVGVQANAGVQAAGNVAAGLEDNKAIHAAGSNKVLGDEPGQTEATNPEAEERKPKLRGGQ
ncbi:hypothetical protein ACP4OV_005244 [Aristida adscensionis]